MSKIIKRSDKKLFYGVPVAGNGAPTYTRARYFTGGTVSKNPVEYSRRYIDEESERTDVVGYSPSISYGFDQHTDDPVLADVIAITDGELVGTDTHRTLVIVDFSNEVDGGWYAMKREYAVIPNSEGDSTDAYTYSGTFKAAGDKVIGTAMIATPDGGNSKNVETIDFIENDEV